MIREHTCITVACDVCQYKFDEDEYTAHFADLNEARKALTGTGWTITADRKVFCASGDTEHQAALDALMPPEPVMQTPGQLSIDTDQS
ncbi:hypothetical protein GCM10009601_51620 [Streptomyces thermospinosisporus]|uniref:Ferredoxin n=1 Tax=Streptomyces thermospinosisporus TaxID=161482 RepID=A0ABN1Z4Q2_9ACTN